MLSSVRYPLRWPIIASVTDLCFLSSRFNSRAWDHLVIYEYAWVGDIFRSQNVMIFTRGIPILTKNSLWKASKPFLVFDSARLMLLFLTKHVKSTFISKGKPTDPRMVALWSKHRVCFFFVSHNRPRLRLMKTNNSVFDWSRLLLNYLEWLSINLMSNFCFWISSLQNEPNTFIRQTSDSLYSTINLANCLRVWSKYWAIFFVFLN